MNAGSRDVRNGLDRVERMPPLLRTWREAGGNVGQFAEEVPLRLGLFAG